MSGEARNQSVRISRGFNPDELADLYKIETDCFSPILRWTKEDFDRVLQTRRWSPSFNIELWVARVEGKPIGFLLGGERRGDAHLLSVEVLRKFRGQGTGKKLIRAFEDEFRPRVKEFQLEVHPDNPAQILYFNLGYRVMGTRLAYYANGDICLRMAKKAIATKKPSDPQFE